MNIILDQHFASVIDGTLQKEDEANGVLCIINIQPFVEGVMVDYHTRDKNITLRKNNITRHEEGDMGLIIIHEKYVLLITFHGK